jgi:hypothetical protein
MIAINCTMEAHPLTLVWEPPEWVGTMTDAHPGLHSQECAGGAQPCVL